MSTVKASMRDLRATWLAPATALLLSSAGLAHAAGLQLLTVEASANGPALAGAVWYPCPQPATEIRIGLAQLTATGGCPLPEKTHPLVVVSHGRGGAWYDLHDVAETLADAGFVVAAIDHPGDSRDSATRHDRDLSSLAERPADISRLIDYMLGAWPGAAHIDPERIGFFGFSRGGFTGLALIGADPDWQIVLSQEHCPVTEGSPWCRDVQAKIATGSALTRDPRIKAAVLADPPWGRSYTVANLKNVTVPVQLWASERGFPAGDVLPGDAAVISENLQVKPEYLVVKDSWHFDFLPACSETQARVTRNGTPPDICADSAGFDRAGFHRQLDGSVLAFFQNHFVAASSLPQ